MNNKSNKIDNILSLIHGIYTQRSKLEEKPICIGEGVILTPREIHTIAAIGDFKNINIKELGDSFGVSKSAASQMINKLVKKGFVTKSNPPDNNKEFRLILTDAGKKVYFIHEDFHQIHKDEIKNKLEKFSKKDLEAAKSILNVIQETIEDRLENL